MPVINPEGVGAGDGPFAPAERRLGICVRADIYKIGQNCIIIRHALRRIGAKAHLWSKGIGGGARRIHGHVRIAGIRLNAAAREIRMGGQHGIDIWILIGILRIVGIAVAARGAVGIAKARIDARALHLPAAAINRLHIIIVFAVARLADLQPDAILIGRAEVIRTDEFIGVPADLEGDIIVRYRASPHMSRGAILRIRPRIGVREQENMIHKVHIVCRQKLIKITDAVGIARVVVIGVFALHIMRPAAIPINNQYDFGNDIALIIAVQIREIIFTRIGRALVSRGRADTAAGVVGPPVIRAIPGDSGIGRAAVKVCKVGFWPGGRGISAEARQQIQRINSRDFVLHTEAIGIAAGAIVHARRGAVHNGEGINAKGIAAEPFQDIGIIGVRAIIANSRERIHIGAVKDLGGKAKLSIFPKAPAHPSHDIIGGVGIAPDVIAGEGPDSIGGVSGGAGTNHIAGDAIPGIAPVAIGLREKLGAGGNAEQGIPAHSG